MIAKIFDAEKATAIENSVSIVFECAVLHMVSMKDTDAKKVLVYVLFSFYKFDLYQLGNVYKISPLYVKAIANAFENKYLQNIDFREKILTILKQTGYASTNMDRYRNRAIA